jgi:hypothetical protein
VSDAIRGWLGVCYPGVFIDTVVSLCTALTAEPAVCDLLAMKLGAIDWIGGSYSGGCEEYYVLGCDAV